MLFKIDSGAFSVEYTDRPSSDELGSAATPPPRATCCAHRGRALASRPSKSVRGAEAAPGLPPTPRHPDPNARLPPPADARCAPRASFVVPHSSHRCPRHAFAAHTRPGTPAGPTDGYLTCLRIRFTPLDRPHPLAPVRTRAGPSQSPGCNRRPPTIRTRPMFRAAWPTCPEGARGRGKGAVARLRRQLRGLNGLAGSPATNKRSGGTPRTRPS